MHIFTLLKGEVREFPGGPVVKNLPCNAGDMGSVPGRGTQIPHAMGQLSLHTSRQNPCATVKRCHVAQPGPSAAKEKQTSKYLPNKKVK